ncbi:hypothetical protein M0Q50_03450 [bacterium]|jgi:hypothetical protein|nr:hypothetical protein [bacterium]
MMPSKGRRDIVVNGILYHYSIKKGSPTIRNSVTGEIMYWNNDYYDKIVPSFIRELILCKCKYVYKTADEIKFEMRLKKLNSL